MIPMRRTREATLKRMHEEEEKLKLLQELKGEENVTLDGHKINIYANIGSVGDIGYVLENDAGGIGLFRSEFLYLGRDDFPTEEEQIPGVPSGRTDDGRQESDHPYSGYRSGQAGGLLQSGQRGQSRPRIPCDPYLPEAAGYF